MHSNTRLAALALSFTLLYPAVSHAEGAQTARAARTITVQSQPEASKTKENEEFVKFSEYPANASDKPAKAAPGGADASGFLHAPDTTLVQADAKPALATTAKTLREAADPKVYEDVLKSLTLTSVDYTGAVEKNINMFSVNLRKHFVRYLERSGRYMGIMQSILRENYMPEDLVFLALIESGFNPKAYSWAKASGPWQFISGTGKRYGLKIDNWVDERRDPIKSTRAAAAYLKDLYNMFGSWSLAMASYNAGEGNVARAVKRNGSQDYWQLRQSRYMHPETKEYVPKFMAAKIIAENPEAYGFSGIEYDKPFEFDEVEVTSPTSLEVAAKCCQTTLQEMKDLNPELKRACTPPNIKSYKLRVPKGTRDMFLANYQSMPETDKTISGEYTVRRGDTLYRIASKFGVSVSDLASMNQMSSRSRLRRGQVLTVPVSTGGTSEVYAESDTHAEPAEETSVKETARTSSASYKVRRGDTLSTIARRHGTTTRKLARLNGISTRSKIRAGQTLKVSGSSTKTAGSSRHSHSSASSYRVRSSDTLWKISQRHGVSMDALMKANSLGKRSVIRRGQRLVIPS
ncbi:MAG: LysM peptidoglycan-binding domain-containing protein [Nitrospirae bacterium]|nr:LysM peptidoglycan-binding domain-containing protein [Nitrospirota bacterium]